MCDTLTNQSTLFNTLGAVYSLLRQHWTSSEINSGTIFHLPGPGTYFQTTLFVAENSFSYSEVLGN